MKLRDKVVIITGAGQGLGRAYALRLAEEGAKAVIAEKDEQKAQKVAEEIRAKGMDALAVKTDVSDEESTHVMARFVVEKYGSIDVLVNNASIFATIKMKPFHEITSGEWDDLMAVNLRGLFLCCKAVVPSMKAKKKGKIINISSSTVFLGRPYYIHYVTSKAGVIGFTRGLAKELGDWNINVNCISPGAVQTEVPRDSVKPEQMKAMIAERCIKRVEVPEDLIGAMLFFASEESDFITGQNLIIDGGIAFQ
jgi:3-oxoacyl-[acyl-carrier protein] reductase